MFIFVCDQSPSMGVGGKLDTVKAAIEGFCGMYVKQSMAQPLMLLGCCNEGSKSHVLRSSIVDPVGIFEDEMKMMTASSASEEVGADFSQAVDYALSILSKFRLRDSIDAFGFGRKLLCLLRTSSCADSEVRGSLSNSTKMKGICMTLSLIHIDGISTSTSLL